MKKWEMPDMVTLNVNKTALSPEINTKYVDNIYNEGGSSNAAVSFYTQSACDKWDQEHPQGPTATPTPEITHVRP